MDDVLMHDYNRLSEDGDDSDSSNRSIGQPPSFNEVLEKHGYTIKEEVGRGATGIVFLVTKGEKDQFVVKQMNSRDRKELATVKKEIEILMKLIHGYIVSYVDSFEDKQSGLFYIVMEYCTGGDLFKKMQTQKERGFFEEQQILDWFVQICLALQYIHENNVLHRDIRPQNVFLTEDGYINLGDFGSSIILERTKAYAASVVGAENYISPEVLQKKYNSKSDIWSLGWLLHDLCMLDVWSDSKRRWGAHASSFEGTPPHISERYSEELQELIGQMLSCDPKDRPSADEILAKPFLEDAVKRNKRIPEALEQKLIKSIRAFDEAYNKHYKEFEILVRHGDSSVCCDSAAGLGCFFHCLWCLFIINPEKGTKILDWFVQICLALQYIHENNVLHRDIRPQNVFLTEEGYINLGDFGCSKILERVDAYAASVVGASLYVSPEVYQKKYNSKRYTECTTNSHMQPILTPEASKTMEGH
ncbi:serine threonine- kinase Nek4-like protein [Labeo rohita]|uniref:non-specific serine/threonine protein kinase n=1 Tax=Labeo rohita TaxID=84645 RepID=A0A498NMJ7_LABRO|nr:serine threonine- kinase Nek4-like protein [Labeo rohita]